MFEIKGGHDSFTFERYENSSCLIIMYVLGTVNCVHSRGNYILFVSVCMFHIYQHRSVKRTFALQLPSF